MSDRTTTNEPYPSTSPDTRSIRIVRGAWLGVATVSLALWTLIPASQWNELFTVCHPDSACRRFQFDAASVQGLREHGVSLHAYAAFTVAVLAVTWLTWYGLGALIVWRKPKDRGAILCAFFLALFPLWETVQWIPPSSPWTSLSVVFITMLLIFVLLFPDGHFAPTWTRWFAIGIVAFFVAALLPIPALSSGIGSEMQVLLVLGIFLGVIVAQIQRFRSVSTWTQRQQTKWAFTGLVLAILLLLLSWFGGAVAPFPTGDGSIYLAFTNLTGTGLILTAIPVSITIAILRSRLWDIDHVINRALVYAALTVALAALYIGSVLALEPLFQLLGAGGSNLAIAISTLIAAALFSPLRRYIQIGIDRRFYRRKYDATRTLADFTARVRDEVELAQVSRDVTDIVKEVLQPAHVSLWLAGSQEGGKS